MMLCLTIQGCATKERIVYVKPECEPPATPKLRDIKAADLWDAVGQKVYDDLMYNQTETVNWALDMKAMINVLCKKAGE